MKHKTQIKIKRVSQKKLIIVVDLMITIKQRYVNTIYTIEYAEEFETNQALFVEGILILKNRIKNNDYSEFNIEEIEILESIFEKINY